MTPNVEYGFYASLGERLRAARHKAGLSQDTLGVRLGVTGKAISQYESATHRMSLYTYERLRRVLGEFA